jgi:hypothetical protein
MFNANFMHLSMSTKAAAVELGYGPEERMPGVDPVYAQFLHR